jgi:hypothetical protein
MSVLSWNCRDLRQPLIVEELVRLVRTYCPKIVFISESRQQVSRVRNIKDILGLSNCFMVKVVVLLCIGMILLG